MERELLVTYCLMPYLKQSCLELKKVEICLVRKRVYSSSLRLFLAMRLLATLLCTEKNSAKGCLGLV